MYDVILKLLDSSGSQQAWQNYIDSNFTEEQLTVFKFILNSFPENLLINKTSGGLIPNEDVISVLALLSYVIGDSREYIKNLDIAKDLDSLYNNLTENNEKLLYLLLEDMHAILFNDSTMSIEEKLNSLNNYKNLLKDSYNYIKYRGTERTLKNVLINYFLDKNIHLELVESTPSYVVSRNLINSNFVTRDSNYIIYNTIPISISGSQEYTFSIDRNYVDGQLFTLTIETYDALEETLLDYISMNDSNLEFDTASNTWYLTFTSDISAALLYFTFTDNGGGYIVGGELVDVQLEEGTTFTEYIKHNYSVLEYMVDQVAPGEVKITLGTLEEILESIIDYSVALSEVPPYTYNIKADSILYKYLVALKPAGMIYNVETTSTKEALATPAPLAPSLSLESVNYSTKSYTVKITNNDNLTVTAFVGDYESGGVLPNESSLSSIELLPGQYKTVTRVANNVNFANDTIITKIEAYVRYLGEKSEPNTQITHVTDNPPSLVLLSTNVSLTKNSDYQGGYADLSIYNRNVVPVIAKVICSWDGGTTTFTKQYSINPNSYSGSKKFYNSSLVPRNFNISVVLEDNSGLEYLDSDAISKSVSTVSGIYVPSGDSGTLESL